MSKKHSNIKTAYIRYFIALSLFFVFGCSNTKYLPDGELLYTGGSVTVKDTIIKKKERKELETELEGLLRPKPNKQFLGLRPKLWIYNIAGQPKKDKGIRYWLRNKVGEPPVLFSKVDLDYNASVLRNFTENRGYFKTRVSADSTVSNKRVTAEYTVEPKKRYIIKSVTFPDDSLAMSRLIARSSRRSLLKVGKPYDLDIIKAERERIDARLKEKGYYYFNPDYILAQVDSSKGDHEVKIRLVIKADTPPKALTSYKINKIIVYPNFAISKDSIKYKPEDVVQYKDFTIIDTADTFKPRVFDRAIYFKKGDLYNRKDHNLTLNRFVNLGTFSFVKNEFKPSDSLPNTLDSYYYLTLLPKKFIRFEVLGKTNSASYTGTEVNVNWNNRNLFRGAELLTVSVFGGADFQLSGDNNGKNIYKLGTETSLTWPRFIVPFFHVEGNSEYVPRTKAAVRYEYQNRTQLYALNSFKTSFGYQWKENIRKEHQLNVIDVTYVSPNHVTAEYLEDIKEDESLGKVIEKQLIFGPTYTYTYTNTMQKRKKNTFYFSGDLDLAGNITGLATGANVKKNDTIKIFNVPFSQYVKMRADFRHYLKLGKESELASRIIVGAGLPYGNSSALPTSKQFVVGGTNSIRAFRARSLGPGSYLNTKTTNDFLPDQSGDLKLEFSTEYRAKLFSIVRGAVFIDAGNVWLLNADPNKPGGEITKDFMKDIAVGAGAGLRFDLSFLVLRTDLAFPLRKPYLPEGERWVIKDIDFGSGPWRKDNLILNIAIGYPF
ncbi:outer membrane protein assembly factor BamA [Flavobacterium sp. 90]|uniref:translocation and assembly module lipoprotein TamL n=1 Tax=unclassified Flavobacterium TaxID=196869 RepID=UPI000EB197BA|nr:MULTISPECIES: BamA/TamA family outer membrane protein [unclassified Flavobacterium]RKR09186.1 outer membrane protein assembly factor BamA [Flavobacterium sp. 81]TCK52970.1 outer membrane protein assembly factor BamA [Flavobacterium sp. 90]